jgi:hypothetical protein
MSDTRTSIQAYLDSLSQQPGSILYRSTRDWLALPPGLAGQVLSVDANLLPTWVGYQTYWPAAQQFNASNAYFLRSGVTYTGNKISTVARFRQASFTGGGTRYLCSCELPTGTRNALWMDASDHASSDRRGRILWNARNTANTTILFLASTNRFDDDEWHNVKAEYDAATGTATLTIDGTDEDNTSFSGRVKTTGTLANGAGGWFGVGARMIVPDRFWGGRLSYMGYHEVTGLDWADFFDAYNRPINIEATVNTAWTSAPKFWHESARFDENRGTAGNATKNGALALALPSTWS